MRNDQLIKTKDGKELPRGLSISVHQPPSENRIRNIRSDDITVVSLKDPAEDHGVRPRIVEAAFRCPAGPRT